MMRSASIFLLALFVSSCVRGGEAELFDGILRQFPAAKEGEFPTPESVVRTYFEGLFSDKLADTFRCVPLREFYASSNFQTDVKRMQMFAPGVTLPGDYYSRFIRALGDHYKRVNQFRIFLLVKSDPKASELLEKNSQAKLKGDEVDAEWIDSIAKLLSFENLKGYRIKGIVQEPAKVQPKSLYGISIADLTTVKVTITGENPEFSEEIQVFVAQVNGNYQILSFPMLAP